MSKPVQRKKQTPTRKGWDDLSDLHHRSSIFDSVVLHVKADAGLVYLGLYSE